MKIQMKERALGLCLLTFLISCGTKKQAPLVNLRSERVMSLSEDTAPAMSRREDIPLIQLDASTVYAGMIDYITPEANVVVPEPVTEKLTAYIAYPPEGISVDSRYGKNRAEIEKLKERLQHLLRADNNLQAIHLTGYASPDGDTDTNERLAGNRAIRFKEYLLKQLRLSDKSLITIDWVGEDWEGLRKMIAASGKKYTAQVLSILDRVTDADIRRKQIKALEKGAVYKDIEKSFFSRLRRMELTVTVDGRFAVPVAVPISASLQELAAKVYTNSDRLMLDELLQVATLYRPGTEQYREVYELAAYRFPDCIVAQLNAGAAALAQTDTEAARFFLEKVENDPRAWINLGVLALMENNTIAANSWFRKALPVRPLLARTNLQLLKMLEATGSAENQ